ncbi:sterol desaturase family protein [Pseudoduganella sp. OTU4001]|uniref:sterol desaturase family protein n=1 Tax=Pseudoduganella sp. OTU4001 TaxID=3043854 RepID=UPI00313AE425
MNRAFLQGFLPLALLASLASFSYARAVGANLELAVIAPAVAALLLAMLAERRMPYRAAWGRPQGDVATDLASTALLFALVDPLLKWLAPIAVLAALGGTPLAGMLAIFPTGWPFALQVVLAALLAEFGSYWSHRLHHTQPALWWLHALHHDSERLYALNNFRIHPLNYALNYLLGIVPLLVIGVPQEVMLGYFALSLPVLMTQHANLPLQNGWLNYIFSTNEVHRWHHSAKEGEGDSNFGRALVIWDQVFGTFRYHPQRNDPTRVGLYAGSRQSIFLPACCQ